MNVTLCPNEVLRLILFNFISACGYIARPLIRIGVPWGACTGTTNRKMYYCTWYPRCTIRVYLYNRTCYMWRDFTSDTLRLAVYYNKQRVKESHWVLNWIQGRDDSKALFPWANSFLRAVNTRDEIQNSVQSIHRNFRTNGRTFPKTFRITWAKPQELQSVERGFGQRTSWT